MKTGPELLLAVNAAEMSALGERRELRLAAGETLRVKLASGGHWFGHGFSHEQPCPLESGEVVNENFAVNNIQSPIWMCSAGVAILADTCESLCVKLNANGSGLLEVSSPNAELPLRFFCGENLPAAHRELMKHLGWPGALPGKSWFTDSVWCTWTQFPRCINQERILDMAREIREQEYPCSTITIDDRWESCYGELDFSPEFPEPRRMIDELHELGFKVVLWVTPFVNREAKTFADLAAQNRLVPSKNGGAAMLKWWGGEAGLVDLTNAEGRDWYREQLLRLKTEFGVDGFKIDGGDAKYQPDVSTAAWREYRGASGYVDELLGAFEEVAPGACETRTAWLSQKRNVIPRQGGKDSHWGGDNGLKALVRLALNMSLMGYDLVMPDMIPGRVQTMSSEMSLPTDELMIRWTEASAFMPSMQFSYYPWNYGGKTAAAVKALARAHSSLGEYILSTAENREAPLLRPMCYGFPDAEELYAVNDQYMLGPDIVVAPVLDDGVRERDVRLPPGVWRNAWSGEVFTDKLLEKFPAPCPGAPVFVRAGNLYLYLPLHEELKRIERDSVESKITSATYCSGIDRDLSVTG